MVPCELAGNPVAADPQTATALHVVDWELQFRKMGARSVRAVVVTDQRLLAA
jgi:hypothetical protein